MNTKLITTVAALAGALLLPALATATPTPLTPPAIPGAAGLPGPVAPAATRSTIARRGDLAPRAHVWMMKTNLVERQFRRRQPLVR